MRLVIRICPYGQKVKNDGSFLYSRLKTGKTFPYRWKVENGGSFFYSRLKTDKTTDFPLQTECKE